MPRVTAPATADRPKIALAPNWSSPVQGGEMIRKDLAALFAGRGSVGNDGSEPSTAMMVYQDIAFLSLLMDARKRLHLDGVTPSKTKVACPGLPLGSFSAHGFASVFEGGYTRLYLLTDTADQVVSVLLVDENPRQRTPEVTDALGYHTYNFIHQRVRGTNDLVVKHEFGKGAPSMVVVESMLIDPNAPENAQPSRLPARSSTRSAPRASRTGRVLERSVWYVPVPVVDLILRCVGNR